MEVRDGDKLARLEPYFGFKLSFTIDFATRPSTRPARRSRSDFADTSYVREIARAHTFGFAHEVEALREMGLARGGAWTMPSCWTSTAC